MADQRCRGAVDTTCLSCPMTCGGVERSTFLGPSDRLYPRPSDKIRTNIAERFVQPVRGIQKTLLCHIEAAPKVAIPDGHLVTQWAAMHAAWLCNRYQVHATMSVTPFQSLRSRPCHGKLASFGPTVFGLDPTATKFKPASKKCCWRGKIHQGWTSFAQIVEQRRSGKSTINGMLNSSLV